MRDHRRAGAGAVREEDIDATERLAHLGAPRPVGPEVLVVLADDQRDARGSGARGRPPGAEHVGVDEVGGGEPGIKPRGEARLRNPLQVPALAPDLGLRAVPPRELDAGRGRPAAVKDGGDPMAAQLAHHAQHRQLRAARLELGDHSRDEHNPEPLAGGRRSFVNELGPRRPQPPWLAHVTELCVHARQERGPPPARGPEHPISVPILFTPQLEDALAAGAPAPDATRVLPAQATEAA